jgi:GNAT superfamily N-acetyltransferase
MLRSLGYRTDLMVLSLQGSAIERRDGYRVIRTPDNPTYHWGNFILLDAPPAQGAVDGWIRLFAREFPGARHLAIGVDGVDADAGDLDELLAAGLEVERITVLTARHFSAPDHPSPQASIRMLEPSDWAKAIALDHAVYPSGSASPSDFTVAQFVSRRLLQERGHGGWFGAFVGERMVAGLGLFDDGSGVARYQSVVTHPDFRGRGLAGALVRFAGGRALSNRAVTTLVIAADPGDAAIRLYRSLGFAGTETQVQLTAVPGSDAT